MAKGEELPKTSPAEIEKLIEQIRASNMDASTKEKLERLLRTVIALLDLLQRKNLSIKRLNVRIVLLPRCRKGSVRRDMILPVTEQLHC